MNSDHLSQLVVLDKGEPDSKKPDNPWPVIVAVHGLNGHHTHSWIPEDSKKTMWLEDLVPSYVPGSRILCFSYRAPEKAISPSWIEQEARTLLDGLNDLSQHKPISFILVGHDLGGFIIKEVLLLSSSNALYSFLAKQTSLIIFFGVRQKIEREQSWETMVGRLINATHYTPTETLSDWIKWSSRALLNVSRRYHYIAGMFNTWTLYEDGPANHTVVDKDSARVQCSLERSYGVQLPHADMCYVMSMENPILNQICESIRKCSSPSALYWECMQTFSEKWSQRATAASLDFPNGAFAWVTQLDAFQIWMRCEEGCVLQISMEPGLFALSDHLAGSCGMQGSTVIYFNFDRRNLSQCSTEAMLASFISQLLTADPACFNRFQDLYDLLNKESSWALGSRWTLFRSLLLVPRAVPIVCIIDGYHNCDATRGYFLSDLISLAQSTVTTVKIIITGASNDLPSVPSHLMIDLHREQTARTQVVHFVTAELAGLFSRDTAFHPFQDYLQDMMTRPEITFLMAKTMLSWLEDLEQRSTLSAMSAVLQSVPLSLTETLRVSLLPRFRKRGSSWAERVLLWVVQAFRPLHIDELTTALALSNKNEQRYVLEKAEIPHNLSKDIRYVFGSFMSVQDGMVFICHESLHQELYETRHEWDSAAEDGIMAGHGRIAHTCIDYILDNTALVRKVRDSWKDGNRSSLRSSSFIEYACQFWSWHYLRSKATKNLEDKALELLSDADTVDLCCRLQRLNSLDDRGDDLLSTQLLMAARMGLQDLAIRLSKESSYDDHTLSKTLEHALAQGSTGLVEFFLERGLPVGNVLHIAAQNGHLHIVDALLRAKADVNTHGHDRMTPLMLASKAGYKEVVKLLLEKGANVGETDATGRTALHFGAQFGHSEVMKRLIYAGASVASTDNSISTPLHFATQSSQLEAIQVLVDNQADLNGVDQDSWTPLHLASFSGSVEAVRILIRRGAEINVRTVDGSTALHWAVQSSDLGTVRELLKMVPLLDVNVTGDNGTPLHLAAIKGLSEIMQELIQCGVDVNARQTDGCTPLHLAAQNGHVQALHLLLQNRSSLNAKNLEGSTALHVAALGGHCGAIRVLLDAGADHSALDNRGHNPTHNAVSRGILEALRILSERGVDLNISTPSGSLLHAAVESAGPEIVQFLLQGGTNPNAVNEDGLSPLHLAARSGNVEILHLLLNYDVDVDRPDFNERTPLTFAAETGHREAVVSLLEAGADVADADDDDGTALHFAARGGHREVVELLLARGAESRAVDSAGKIPLHFAAWHGHVDVVRSLLAQPASRRQLRSTDNLGRTALHIATSHGQIEIAEVLLEHGADPTIPDTEGRSVLHEATRKGNIDLVKLFLSPGVDVDQRDKNGETPLHLAQKLGLQDIVHVLKDKGADPRLITGDGTSLLHFAAASNDVEMVRGLLADQHDPNAVNQQMETPLSFAAGGGHHEIVQLLLEAHARPDGSVDSASGDRLTPLYSAARAQHTQVAHLLLRAGADINYVYNADNRTPFSVFVEYGCLDLVKECLTTMEADPNASPYWPPVYTAAYWAHTEMAKLLLSHGMDAEQCGPNQWTPLHAAFDNSEMTEALLDAGVSVDPRTKDQSTPLYFAAYYKHDETVRTLLKHGANPFLVVADHDTPFHLLMWDKWKAEIEGMLQRPDCTVNMQNESGRTPLCVAASNGAAEIVELLLSRATTDVTLTDHQGLDALHVAISNANPGVIRILLNKGLKITSKHAVVFGRCAAQGSIEAMRILREHDADLDAADDHGWTPHLHAKSTNQRALLSALWPNCDREGDTQALHVASPDRLSILNKSEPIVLDDGGLVAFLPPDESTDARGLHRASVNANHPIPPFDTFYFEIEILEQRDETNAIGIGVCTQRSSLSMFPGWDDSSWGYHSDDGAKFHGGGYGTEYGQRAKVGDVMACQLDTERGELRFSKNGESFGVAYTSVFGCLYPRVSMDTPGSRVRANFGPDFRYTPPFTT